MIVQGTVNMEDELKDREREKKIRSRSFLTGRFPSTVMFPTLRANESDELRMVPRLMKPDCSCQGTRGGTKAIGG